MEERETKANFHSGFVPNRITFFLDLKYFSTHVRIESENL